MKKSSGSFLQNEPEPLSGLTSYAARIFMGTEIEL